MMVLFCGAANGAKCNGADSMEGIGSSVREYRDSIVLSGDTIVEGKILKEIVVNSNSNYNKLTKGGVLTTVAGTSLSTVGTAFDLLALLPGIRSDEGRIEVLGRGVPQIYINGRKMLDVSELQRLTSNEIHSVEVISNPGSKYGAEVMSVILIRTIRKRGDGLSGSFQGMGRMAHSFSQGYDMSLNYRHKGIDIFCSGNFDYSHRYQRQRNIMSIMPQYGNNYQVLSDIGIYPKGYSYLGNLGINWQINSNHSLGAKFEYSASPYSKSFWSTGEMVYLNGKEVEATDYKTYWDGYRKPTDYLNFYYSGKIKNVTVNISNDYYFQRNRQIQLIEEITDNNMAGESVNKKETRLIRNDNKVRNRLYASKGVGAWDYKDNTIEFGYELTSTERRDIFSQDYLPSGNTSIGQTPENINREHTYNADDRIKETTCAGFVSMTVPVGETELSGGIRYEHTVSDYYQRAVLVPTQSRRYSRWYPNFDFTFPISRAKFTFSYTAKTKRPLYSQLSTGLQYDNRFTYESGNPLLTSEMVHDLSLAGIYRWLFFSVSYQYDKDAIVSSIVPFEEDSPVNIMTYRNCHHLSKYSIVMSMSPKIRRWSPRFRLNLLGQVFKIPFIDGKRTMNNPLLFWNWYNSITLSDGLTLSGDITGRTRGDMDVVTLKASWQINLGITKVMRNWYFQLQATDIFRTARNSMITYGERMSLDKWNYSDTQAIRLTIRYSFNTSISKYKGRPAGQNERQRF